MRELGKPVEERDYARRGLTAAEIEALVDAAGGVGGVLSARAPAAKARGWTKEAPPDRASFVAAATADNNLVRRPILVLTGSGPARVVVGNDADAIRAALGSRQPGHVERTAGP